MGSKQTAYGEEKVVHKSVQCRLAFFFPTRPQRAGLIGVERARPRYRNNFMATKTKERGKK